MEAKNLKEAKRLYRRYRRLINSKVLKDTWKKSKKEIDGIRNHGDRVMYKLTGFNSRVHCTLCQTVNHCCDQCIYIIHTNATCSNGKNIDTFWAIANAETLKQLRIALENRANHIESIISLKS